MSITLEVLEKPNVAILRQKIGWLCHLIRGLVIVWIVWQFYINFRPLMSPSVTAWEWNSYWGLALFTVTIKKVLLNRAIVFISWIAAAFLGWAVWRLMDAYLRGDILSPVAATQLRLVGITGLVAAITDIGVRPLLVGVLSTENFKHYQFMDWFEPRDLLYILIGLFILALSYIQGTAAAINDEHRQFV